MDSPSNPYFNAFTMLNIPYCIDINTDFYQLEKNLQDCGLTDRQAVFAHRVLYDGMIKRIDWKYLGDYDQDWVVDNIFTKSGLRKEIIRMIVDAIVDSLGVRNADDYPNCDLEKGVFNMNKDCSEKNVVVPKYLYSNGNVYKIRKIGDKAFEYCTSLESVSIPDSVTEIGWSAFSGCIWLESVSIPDSVTEIEEGAFSGCFSLSDISVSPKNRNYASDNGNLYSLDRKTLIRVSTKYTAFTIPNSVKEIEKGAFSHCTSLESVKIPDTVTEIRRITFEGCLSLKSVDIPDSVTRIGESAFSSCTSLKSVNIPDSVTRIGERAFQGCTSLESVNIPDSLEGIGWRAFSWCSNLSEISVSPKNRNYASDNGNLYSLDRKTLIRVSTKYTAFTIPNSVKEIEEGAFSHCTSLKSVDIPDSVTEIYRDAFEGCTSLESVDIPDSVTEIKDYAFKGCTSLKSVDIPDSVTWIEEGAFEGCTSLESVDIPDSVTWIEDYAFKGCTSLMSIELPEKMFISSESFDNNTKIIRKPS